MTIRQFTENQEWLDIADRLDEAVIGVTDVAVVSLGPITAVRLPATGATFARGDRMGELQTATTRAPILAPAELVVLGVNEAVVEQPALVHRSPFDDGWLIKARLTGSTSHLLDEQSETIDRDEQSEQTRHLG